MSDDAAPSELLELVRDGVVGTTLAAHLSVLLDARVSLLVAGPAARATRERVAALLAAASPLHGGGDEIEIESDERFIWLADPSAVGCTTVGAGSAPRSPRGVRLRARGVLEGLDPAVARVLVRSLARGFQLIASAAAIDLAALFDALRATPHRIPEDDVQRLGVVLVVADQPAAGQSAAVGEQAARGRLLSAHLLHAPSIATNGGDRGEATRRAPALLASWSEAQASWDDFSWAAIPDLAARCGITHESYAALLARREELLATSR